YRLRCSTMKLKFTTVLPVSLNALYQNASFYNPKTKSYQSTGKRILTREGKKVKSQMRADALIAVREQKWDIEAIGDNYIYMDIKVYFNRHGRDSDNLLKSLQDSLQGVVFNNDSKVLPRFQKAEVDRGNPRIEIEFSPVNFIGVFDSEDQADNFKATCEFGGEKGCS